MLFYFIILPLSFFLIYIYIYGVSVKYVRNTGPDFSIMKSSFFYNSSIEYESKRYTLFYPTKTYDTDEGFLDPSPVYVVVGRVKDLHTPHNSEMFPRVDVVLFFRIEWLYALICLLVILLLLLVGVAKS